MATSTKRTATDRDASAATTRAGARDEAAWDGDTMRGEPELTGPADRAELAALRERVERLEQILL